MGNLKSVSESRRTYEEHFEFRVKRSHKYWGASSCRDLKTIVLDSLATSCSMVSWSISGLLGVSKLLLVIILAPGGGGVLDQILDWDVPSRFQNHTRSLYQFFQKCIPDFIPIFQNIYPTLYQFSENAYLTLYQL